MCLFCDILDNPHLHRNPEDIIIDTSDNFYAKPALGQFVEGYILVNSKKHYLNMSYINDNKIYTELGLFIEKIKSRISKFSNTGFLIFEHGSFNKFCLTSSCKAPCIDHAHIHIVPTNVSVVKVLKQNFSFNEIDQLKDISNFKGQSYIYHQFQNKHIVFNINKHIQSQFVRKLICTELGIPDYWNWASYPFREKIIHFLDKY